MSEPLVLLFKSDTNDARNAIANLASTVVSNMVTIGSAMKSANDNVSTVQAGFQALPGILARAAAGFVAFEAVKLSLQAVSAAAEAAQKSLQEIVDIGKNAQNAGVGTNFFQEWAHQAASLNLETEKLVAMLDRARAATTVTLGTNGAANASQMQNLLGQHVAAGNIGQGDVNAFNSADTQEKKIRDILDLIDRLRASGKELAALNIGTAMFGADFANQLRNGVDLTGKMRDALTNIQDVKFPPDIVQKAQELDQQLKAAQETMERGWAPIQQDILRWQQDMLQNVADLKTDFADIVGTLGRWYTAVKNVGDEIRSWGNMSWLHDMNKWMESKGMLSVPLLTDQQRQDMVDDKNDDEHPLSVGVGRKDTSRPLPKASSSSGSQTDQVDTYIESLRKSVAVLQAENDNYGKSNTLKAEAVDLEKALAAARQRGTPLTDAEREAVKKLADEEGAAKDKAAELAKAHESAQALMQYAGNQTLSVLDKIGQKGTSLKSIIEDLAKSLLKAAEQAVLLGSGPLAGLFGTQNTSTLGGTGGLFGMFGGGGGLFSGLFGGSSAASNYSAAAASAAPGMYGPGFASGGLVGRDGEPTWIPHSALIGARAFATGGGIGAILHPGEIVLNQAQQKNVAHGLNSGPSIQITHAPTINGTGLSAEQLTAVLDRNNKSLARHIGSIQANWQMRHG